MFYNTTVNTELANTDYYIPGALVVKNPSANTGDKRDTSSIPGMTRSPGGWHSNPLQYSCLENPMNRGAWQATVHRVAQSWTQLKQLSRHARSHRVKAAQSCLTHCDPIPGHGILQARILE